MAITVNWATRVILIPENEATISTVVSTSPDIYEYDLNLLRLELKDIEDSPQGMAHPPIQSHVAAFTVGNVQLARVIGLINGYTIEFEDGQYLVQYAGANTDFSEPVNRVINQVSVTNQNSAGLITTASTIDLISAAVWDKPKDEHVVPASMGFTMVQLSYLNRVWVDPLNITGNATAGQIPGINGLPTSPCTTLADARIIADLMELTTYSILSDATLDAAHPNWTFISSGKHLVSLAGFDVEGAAFKDIHITGVMNGRVRGEGCEVQDVTDISGEFFRCGMEGVISIAAGATLSLTDCHTEVVAGLGPVPCFDFAGGADARLAIHGFSGRLEIINMTQADNIATVELIAGNIVLGASNTAGNLLTAGVGQVVDTSAGTTVFSVNLINNTSITDAVHAAAAYSKRDNITYDGNGFPVSGRERWFPDKATCDAATYGGTGEGETHTFDISATPDGTFPNVPRTFDKVQSV